MKISKNASPEYFSGSKQPVQKGKKVSIEMDKPSISSFNLINLLSIEDVIIKTEN
jgi:hypothetical protein